MHCCGAAVLDWDPWPLLCIVRHLTILRLCPKAEPTQLPQLLLQVSAVCQKFAQAAGGVIAQVGSLHLIDNPRPNLASGILQNWAPPLQSLTMDQPSYGQPGALSFVEAVRNLSYLEIHFCYGVLEAGQVDSLLLTCSSLQTLCVSATHVPSIIPKTLKHLIVMFLGDRPQRAQYDPQEPSALLCRLTQHTALESVHFSFMCSNIQLACPRCLPVMRLSISFTLADDTKLDFSWLGLQRCSAMTLSIRLATTITTQHQMLLSQLHQLAISELQLNLSQFMPSDIQHLWKHLTVKRVLTVLVSKDGFNDASHALQALPISPSIVVKVSGRFKARAAPLVVSWAAIASHPARVSFHLDGWGLIVLDGCSTPPMLEERPWQLVIHSVNVVAGLQALCARAGVRYMQNAAARVAQWTLHDRDVD